MWMTENIHMHDQQGSNQKQFEGSGGELKWAITPMAQKPRVNPENSIFICINIYWMLVIWKTNYKFPLATSQSHFSVLLDISIFCIQGSAFAEENRSRGEQQPRNGGQSENEDWGYRWNILLILSFLGSTLSLKDQTWHLSSCLH